MKNQLKKIFHAFGLMKYAIGIKAWNFDRLYGKVDSFSFSRMGIDIEYDTSDNYSKRWFYPRYDNGKIHEPIASGIFIENIQEGDCVLDIGGHIGYFTCLSSKLASKGTVHTFEVDSNCIPLINKNIARNGFQNVIVNNYAVSDHLGTEKIPISNKPNAELKIQTVKEEFKEVKSVTVDEYVRSKDLTPDFIKIDVEGAEWKVLNGMENVLNLDRIKLLIEIHVDFLADHFNIDYKQILELLENKGFQMEEIESHRSLESGFRKITRDSTLAGNTMVFCVKDQ